MTKRWIRDVAQMACISGFVAITLLVGAWKTAAAQDPATVPAPSKAADTAAVPDIPADSQAEILAAIAEAQMAAEKLKAAEAELATANLAIQNAALRTLAELRLQPSKFTVKPVKGKDGQVRLVIEKIPEPAKEVAKP